MLVANALYHICATGKELHFYVYNAVADKCRDVMVIPNDTWGGEGCLGCGIGHGYVTRA